MSTAISPAESRVLLRNISWATFERILAETDRRGTRFTYDRGVLEIISPSREHERCKTYLGRMIESMTEESGIPISSGGSTTLKSQMLKKGSSRTNATTSPTSRGCAAATTWTLASTHRRTWRLKSISPRAH